MQSVCWPSLARYSWASAIVTSRAFSLATAPTCGGEAAAAVEALVPLADLLNHARRRETSYHLARPFINFPVI